ncbi:hypothetical protein DDE74_34290 [Streptomyces lydicus]|uniref:Enoyl-CoA hydratase n=1 Tax=Streptomyces lydicus TaxID=47763 RepID=A0A3Q9KE72_9ACTN|nr:hypothetical protein [Streptomyces lydicus]AZS75303.1 hypothetical protein DDE74_34290 [Streptomyces lydicus]
MSVRVERAGPVTTVVLSRPASRNAVDGATAGAARFTAGAGRHGAPDGSQEPGTMTPTAPARPGTAPGSSPSGPGQGG